jgi:hypothetical protein
MLFNLPRPSYLILPYANYPDFSQILLLYTFSLADDFTGFSPWIGGMLDSEYCFEVDFWQQISEIGNIIFCAESFLIILGYHVDTRLKSLIAPKIQNKYLACS